MTVLVRYLTTARGPSYRHDEGETRELEVAEAEELASGGYAVILSSTPPASTEMPPPPEPETAELKPAVAMTTPETATAAPQRSQQADDVVAAELAGRDQAATGGPFRLPVGIDGRSILGRARRRGYDAYVQEHASPQE